MDDGVMNVTTYCHMETAEFTYDDEGVSRKEREKRTMMMNYFRWPFTATKRRARCARRSRSKDRLLAHSRPRTLRLEAAEPRLLLSHTAPLLNSSGTAVFSSVSESAPVSSNNSTISISSLLPSGGPIVYNQPLGNNFLSIDTFDGGQEGIAVTGVRGAGDGAWEYFPDNGINGWTILPPDVSPANAVRLSADGALRFFPNAGFSGKVSISFAAWDGVDGAQSGSRVDLTAPNATGGTTAYSTATAEATLQVAPGMSISPQSVVNSIAGAVVARSGTLARQNLFTVAPDGLVQEDTYFDSTHSDTGWSAIDSSTTFSAAANLTAYSDGSTTNVFGVAPNGKLMWNQYTAAAGWTGFVTLDNLIANDSATFSPGMEVAAVAEPGLLRLFAVATNSDVREYTYYASSNAWGLSDPNDTVSYAANVPLAVWDSGSSIDVFGVLANNSVQQLHYNGSNWGAGTVFSNGNYLTAPAPLAICELGSDIYLYGVTGSGAIDETYYDGSVWHWGNILSAGSDTFANKSAPGVYQWGANDFTIYGVDNNGQIKDVFNYGSGVANQILGGSPPYASSATSPGISLYTDSSGIQQIFGATKSGDLAVLDFNLGNGSWGEHPLGRSLSPTTTTDSISSGQVTTAGNLSQQHVFQVGGDGLVREDKYSYNNSSDSGLAVIDPNTTFNLAANMAAYTDGNSTNVFAVNGSGSLTWAQDAPGRGWTGFLPLDSFVFSTGASFPAGAPLAAAAQNGYLYLFGVATDGHVREYTYTAGANTWTLADLSSLPAFAQGTPLAVWNNGSSIDLFGVLSGGSIEWLHESGGTWSASAAVSDANLAAGTPLAVSEVGGGIFLFGVNSSGKVDEISYNGSTWSAPSTLSAGSDTFANNSAPGVYQWGANGFTIYGVDNNGQIKDVFNYGSGVANQVLGGSPAYAASSTISLYTDASGIQQMFGETTSGGLAVLNFNLGSGAWEELSL